MLNMPGKPGSFGDNFGGSGHDMLNFMDKKG